MRRPTLIMIIVLMLLLAAVAVVQLSQDAPKSPYRGPVSPGQLPPTASTSPTK